MIVRMASFVAFRLDEVGKHLAVRPAGRTLLDPPVKVGRIATDLDHRVDRRAAAERPAAR